MAQQYSRQKVLGRGSFGTCWLATDTATGEHVAVKDIAVAGMSGRDADAAVAEVELLRGLRHPYIIRYREAFCHGGFLSICMEYAAGGDLHSRVKRQRQQGHLFIQSKVEHDGIEFFEFVPGNVPGLLPACPLTFNVFPLLSHLFRCWTGSLS